MYCDMTTAGGGWTLVAAWRSQPPRTSAARGCPTSRAGPTAAGRAARARAAPGYWGAARARCGTGSRTSRPARGAGRNPVLVQLGGRARRRRRRRLVLLRRSRAVAAGPQPRAQSTRAVPADPDQPRALTASTGGRSRFDVDDVFVGATTPRGTSWYFEVARTQRAMPRATRARRGRRPGATSTRARPTTPSARCPWPRGCTTRRSTVGSRPTRRARCASRTARPTAPTS